MILYALILQLSTAILAAAGLPSSHRDRSAAGKDLISLHKQSYVEVWDPLTPRYQGEELHPQDLQDLLIDNTSTNIPDDYTRDNSDYGSTDYSYFPIDETMTKATSSTMSHADCSDDYSCDMIELNRADTPYCNLIEGSSQMPLTSKTICQMSENQTRFDQWWLELDQEQICTLVARLRVGWGLKDPRTNPWYIMKRAEHVLSRQEALTIIYGARCDAMHVAKEHQQLKNHAPDWLMTFNAKDRKQLYLKYAYYHNMSHYTARTQINEFDHAEEVDKGLEAIEATLIGQGKSHLLFASARHAYDTIDDAEAAILMLRTRTTQRFSWYHQLDETAQRNVYKRAFRVIPSSILQGKRDRIDEALAPNLAKGLLRQNQGAEKELIRIMDALL